MMSRVFILRVLYTVLYLHLLPIIVARLFWRSIKSPNYRRRIHERFAAVPKRLGEKPLIWVHAVSVGESIAAVPMVKKLQQQYPDAEICITTTTPTGSDRVQAAFGDSIYHYYLPYDLPSLFNRFITQLKPRILIVMETELWPNMISVCGEMNVPVVLANARMSERSAKGYQRFSSLTQPMLQSLALIAAQSEVDAKRFIDLGATKVENTGSIKFDISKNDEVEARLHQLQNQLNISARRVAIFASTHVGEDEKILPMMASLTQRFPDFLAFIVPRHPERFKTVIKLAEAEGLQVQSVADNDAIKPQTQVLVGNTMGDLLSFYGLADIAFIGGSLNGHGGHNFLEAALWALPTITGPAVVNFQAIADQLMAANALDMVSDESALLALLTQWLEDDVEFKKKGVAAHQLLTKNQGALDKLLLLIKPLLS